MATSFRVTAGTVSMQVLDNLQLSLQRVQKLQGKLSSGREIERPSDNPSGAVSAMSYRSDQRRTEQYTRNAENGLGWLGTADTTLTSSLESIQRVRQLVLQGANGTADTDARAALAAEIKTAKEGLVGLANTAYLNRPIFAGTADPLGQTPPVAAYDADGTYNGNTGAVFRSVGPNASVQVNMDGPSVWGDPAVETLWEVLDDIETHMRSTNPADIAKLTGGYTDPGPPAVAVASDLDRLDTRRLNIQNRLSEIGARYHRVEQMQERAESSLLNISNSLSETENIDLPATIVALQLQQVAYQSALSAAAKVIQPSLVDFLR